MLWYLLFSVLYYMTLGLSVLLLLFGICLAADWPISRRFMAEQYMDFMGMDIERDTCFVEVHEMFLDMARPPVDCSLCKTVKDVDRVRDITPEQFEAKYAYSGVPVVITDGMKNWTAPEYFNFTFFKVSSNIEIMIFCQPN